MVSVLPALVSRWPQAGRPLPGVGWWRGEISGAGAKLGVISTGGSLAQAFLLLRFVVAQFFCIFLKKTVDKMTK